MANRRATKVTIKNITNDNTVRVEWQKPSEIGDVKTCDIIWSADEKDLDSGIVAGTVPIHTTTYDLMLPDKVWNTPAYVVVVCGEEPSNPSDETWATTETCKSSNEYLDITMQDDFTQWGCVDCPTGAYCSESTTSDSIHPVYGFWRVNPSNHQEPTFVECLFKDACFGMPTMRNDKEVSHPRYNDSKTFYNNIRDNVAHSNTSNLTQTCNEMVVEELIDRGKKIKGGYRNDCNGERCRLCATCATNFRRSTSILGKCDQCPDPETNKLLLAGGAVAILCAVVGLVYVTMSEEDSKDNISDAMQKIIINYLQMIALASSLPMEWPAEMMLMFTIFDSVSSGGQHLVSPDCEFTEMTAAELFYQKQVMFATLPVIIVVFSYIYWHAVGLCSSLCCKNKPKKTKTTKGCCCCKQERGPTYHKSYNATIPDKTILTTVLLLFVLYPSIVTRAFSMLHCIDVDGTLYLAMDLQEKCFSDRHQSYVLSVGLPQLIVYVIGLPVAGIFIVGKNRHQLQRPVIKYRFAMLYLGYCDDKWWWEITVVARKVGVVLISVFGNILGVDLQCFLALALVFISIAAHLGGKPYDSAVKRHRILDKLEILSLCVSWATFWSGLLFFLGQSNPFIKENHYILVIVSLVILGTNIVTVMYSVFHFGLEYMEDNRIRKSRASIVSLDSVHKAKNAFLVNRGLGGPSSRVQVTPVPEMIMAEAELQSWGSKRGSIQKMSKELAL